MAEIGLAANRHLTFGERAVGLTFNPGGNMEVQEIKTRFASAIDKLNDLREVIKLDETIADSEKGEKLRMLSVAITDTQTAQMWAVKAVTWQ